MKIIKLLFVLLLVTFMISCNKSNEEEPVIDIKNSFNKESNEKLKNAKIVIKELGGDIKKVDITDLYVSNVGKIAFYSRSIIVNGGNMVVTSKPYSTPEPERTADASIAIMGKGSLEEEIKPENLVAIAKETDGDYLKVTEVPKNAKFLQDKLGVFAIDDDSKGMSEYNSSPLEHIVTIKKNRFLIIKTHKGHYAKLKIKSLYKGGGKTATEAESWDDAYNYFPYLTFTYNYNMKKGNKKLMKKIKLLAIFLLGTSIAFTSCNKDDDSCDKTKTEKTNAKIVTIKTIATGIGTAHTVEDFRGQKGEFVKFSFKEGKIVTSDDWDFAVRGRAFITNGQNDKTFTYIFDEKEPKRTKEVKVITIMQNFEKIKNAASGFVSTSWFKDFSYAKDFYDPIAPAINSDWYLSSSSDAREAWHTDLYRISANDNIEYTLRPVVFLFQTHDGHFAKMVIEKMDRTYADEKEDITYTIKYYYNPKAGSPILDEK